MPGGLSVCRAVRAGVGAVPGDERRVTGAECAVYAGVYVCAVPGLAGRWQIPLLGAGE